MFEQFGTSGYRYAGPRSSHSNNPLLCEQCCANIVGVEPKIRDFLIVFANVAATIFFGLLKFLGLFLFFSIAIWFWPNGSGVPPHMRKKQEEKAKRKAKRLANDESDRFADD